MYKTTLQSLKWGKNNIICSIGDNLTGFVLITIINFMTNLTWYNKIHFLVSKLNDPVAFLVISGIVFFWVKIPLKVAYEQTYHFPKCDNHDNIGMKLSDLSKAIFYKA